MRNNNGGYQHLYSSNQNGENQQYNIDGYNINGFQRSNTYMPPNPYQKLNNMSSEQMNQFNNIPYSNGYMNQQPPIYFPQYPMQDQNPYAIQPSQSQENEKPSQEKNFHPSNIYNSSQQSTQFQPQNPYSPPPLPNIQRCNTYCQ